MKPPKSGKIISIHRDKISLTGIYITCIGNLYNTIHMIFVIYNKGCEHGPGSETPRCTQDHETTVS